MTTTTKRTGFFETLLEGYVARKKQADVKRFCDELGRGATVLVVQPDRQFKAMVLNKRGYLHGEAEVFVQATNASFSGWVPISQILPEGFGL